MICSSLPRYDLCPPVGEVFCVFGLILCLILELQALQAASLEKSTFLRGERDAWAACDDEKAAREAAEGDLAKECEISAELRQLCSALATEAREAREKVAP